MILHAKVPLSSVPFQALYAEFLRTYPADPTNLIADWRADPESPALTEDQAAWVAGEMGVANADFMFRALLNCLDELDPGAIVLAHDEQGFARVSPRILFMAELIPATFGMFVMAGDKAELWPIAKSHNGATIYVRKDVADALRKQFPAASEAKSVSRPASPRDVEIRSEIVARFQAGERHTRGAWHKLVAPNLKATAWRRLWEDMTKQEPRLSAPGPKPKA